MAVEPKDSIPQAKSAAMPEARRERRKLSYKEQRELETIPKSIRTLELEQATLQARLADPQTYAVAGSDVVAMNVRLEEIESELLGLLERWEALEKIG
jgi:ATP-binding cassette subfamily F protein uup